MTEATEVKQYLDITRSALERLVNAINLIVDQLNKGVSPDTHNMEVAALQIRLSCESILFASFDLHTYFLEGLVDRMRKGDKWVHLKKKLERENDRYLPQPTKIIKKDDGVEVIETVDDLVISGEEILKIWGICSEVLHFRNPKKGVINNYEFCADLHRFSVKMFKVLRHHTIYLPELETIYHVYSRGESLELTARRLRKIGNA